MISGQNEAEPGRRFAEIRQLLATWAWAHDSHDPDLIATTFAHDAEYLGACGRDAIADVYRTAYRNSASAQRRHVLSNFLVLEDGPTRVVVQHTLALEIVRGKSIETHLTGLYRDTVVLEKDGWKISRRSSVMDSAVDPGDLPIRVAAGSFVGGTLPQRESHSGG